MPEGLTGKSLDRLSVFIERPPRLELLDVLDEYHFRTHFARPADDYPRKRTDFLVFGLFPTRFAVMRAVRRRPEHTDGAASAGFHRIYVPDVCDVMPRVRVVKLVHRDRRGIVVDSDVGVKAHRHLEAARSASAAGKKVDADVHRA